MNKEKMSKNLIGKPSREKDHLGNQRVNGKRILRRFFKK
jgi:hypothetical protein